MFVNGVLYNSEVWQGLNMTDIAMLEHVDRQLLKVICSGHAKTANEFLYMETAAIPLKHIVTSRRIMYLQNILTRGEDELVKRVFEAQKNNPTTGDFIELVKKDLEIIGLEYDEAFFCLKTKSELKEIIKKKIRDAAFEELKLLQIKHTKVKDIKYNDFKIQPYMVSNKFSTSMVKVLFDMRSSMTKNIKNNFPSMFRSNMRCQLNCSDKEALDSQSHLLHCSVLLKKLSTEEQLNMSQVEYTDIFGTLDQQRSVVLVLTRILELREELLDLQRLPVGQITGPDPAVTEL